MRYGCEVTWRRHRSEGLRRGGSEEEEQGDRNVQETEKFKSEDEYNKQNSVAKFSLENYNFTMRNASDEEELKDRFNEGFVAQAISQEKLAEALEVVSFMLQKIHKMDDFCSTCSCRTTPPGVKNSAPERQRLALCRDGTLRHRLLNY